MNQLGKTLRAAPTLPMPMLCSLFKCLICSSLFAGTSFKSSWASTYHVNFKKSGHMIEPCRRPNESSKILKYGRNPNYGLVDTPIIWTAPKSQAKIYHKTQLLECRLALTHG